MLSIDHEVLCADGSWKFPGELNAGDEIMCYDFYINGFDIKKLRNIVIENHKSDMIHISGNDINIFAKPECVIGCIKNATVIGMNMKDVSDAIDNNIRVDMLYGVENGFDCDNKDIDEFTRLLFEGKEPVLEKKYVLNKPVYELSLLEDDRNEKRNVIRMNTFGGDVFRFEFYDPYVMVCTRRQGRISWIWFETN